MVSFTTLPLSMISLLVLERSRAVKYLNPTNCEYFTSNEESRKEWDEKFRKWEAEFQTIIPRLPKRFVKEFCKEYFHDSDIREVYITPVDTKRDCRYNLKMVMNDGYDSSFCHEITFVNISRLKCDLDFHIGCEWLYCEWLPVDLKTMSIETICSNNHGIYLEFENIKYRKLKHQ